MAEQAVLDEDDYFHRYYEATIENISDAAWRVKKSYSLPKGWEVRSIAGLPNTKCRKSRTDDDRGGYPSEDALQRAFAALGFKKSE